MNGVAERNSLPTNDFVGFAMFTIRRLEDFDSSTQIRLDVFWLILSRLHLSPEGRNDAMALNLDISRTGDIVIAQCSGRIVFGKDADELRRVVLGLLNESKQIVLNLAGIVYIDSSGLETLIASFISARNRKAEIKFAALTPAVRRVLTVTKVDQLFEVYDSTQEAVRSFHPHPEAAAG